MYPEMQCTRMKIQMIIQKENNRLSKSNEEGGTRDTKKRKHSLKLCDFI